MKLKKIITDIILKFCRLFLVFKKINPNKISFISLESDTLSGDFLLISNYLEKHYDYELEYVLVKFEKTLLGNIKYLLSCVRQLFVINTSKLVILDYNNYVVSKFKRSDVNVIQLWHASGAIKKFGNATNRDYKIANYDYVITNAHSFRPFFAEAFGVNQEQVIVTGIPRTDRLFKKRKIQSDAKKMRSMFPQIKDKKVILYAPTFRGRLMKGFKDYSMNLDYVADHLGDEYVLLYKMHPLLNDYVISNHPNVICCNGMSIRQLFSVSDILISDYSAIIFDFSIFQKPMIFYVPDLEEYREEVGLFIDYEAEMPGPICFDEDEVLHAIQNQMFDTKKLATFKDTYFAFQDGKSLSRVITLIDNIMKEKEE